MNARFAKKDIKNFATIDALVDFYKGGGKITLAKPAKRPKKGFTVGKNSKVK